MTAALCWLTAGEIGAAYAARRLSPVELVRALLDRAGRLEPQIHAFIRLDGEQALQAARVAEAELLAGRSRGPLHGVPVAVKDIIDIAGEATTCHSKIMLDHVAREDADVTRRLRAAGAIPFGKAALHEFAIGGPAFDLPFPPARNPWNVDHHPGGSSSGSGAAVAAGFAPLALGTDTGGSIRNPAAMCGIVGLKATYGLVSRRGVFPLSYTLDHVGPMARTVADAALLLDTIAGHDPRDPSSARASAVAGGYGAALEGGARGLRIGFVRHFHEQDLHASPQMAQALEDAAALLRREGAQVCDIQLPPLQELSWPQRVILQTEAWAVHRQWLRERPQDYAGISRRKLLPGAFLSAGDYVRAQQRRGLVIEAIARAFQNVDVLLAANSMETACRIDDDAEVTRTYALQARTPFNLTGHPAIALPCGFSSAGLPLSLQLVGRAFDEKTLLRAARAFERAAPWHEKHPPLV